MICPGDNLTLSCCTNRSSLQWRVNISLTPLRFDRGDDGIRIVNQQSPEMERPLSVYPTVIHFSNFISSWPLISVLTIDGVTTNWNQTMIECARSMQEMSLTTIHIIDHSKIIKTQSSICQTTPYSFAAVNLFYRINFNNMHIDTIL